jgi:hypothetical protein
MLKKKGIQRRDFTRFLPDTEKVETNMDVQ